MKGVYYNEIEPYCVEWLKNLMRKGLIPDGDVDSRSIVDVQPEDIRGYKQWHFFCGIGGWPLALRLAGWADDRQIATGSCPCQPFSTAGKQAGTDDARHLWPHYFRLLDALRPDVAVGEQVAAAIGKHWLDGVFADLEGAGYACEAFVLPACAVNAPHRRDRIVFAALRSALADACRPGLQVGERHAGMVGEASFQPQGQDAANDGECGVVADAECRRQEAVVGPYALDGTAEGESRARHPSAGEPATSGGDCGAVADSRGERRQPVAGSAHGDEGTHEGRPTELHHVAAGDGESADGDVANCDERGCEARHGHVSSAGHRHPVAAARSTDAWRNADWLVGHDGKARRIPALPQSALRSLADGLPAGMDGLRAGQEPDAALQEEIEGVITLLATGVPARTGKLKGLGNAIVPQLCAEFIGALMECSP